MKAKRFIAVWAAAAAFTAFYSGLALAADGFNINKTLDSLTIPFGIATYSLVITAVILGFNIRKKPKLIMKWHKRIAVTALCFATCHGLIVFSLFVLEKYF
jgi:hypothetical protein